MAEISLSGKRWSRIRPTIDTPFQINRSWWEQRGRNLRVELWHHLCPEHRAAFANHVDIEAIDWVDPEMAEVTQMDGLEHLIREHCSHQEGYLHPELPLVDAVFRIFLANGNTPLTPRQLSGLVGRPAETILRTLMGREVYKGLQPVVE